ncbi:MAG: GDP-mannose 4,6-dehydratase [Labilithrix sp.]|nr:GDP-mannose 4,6-dehydratase [Labilithrix sp.]MCW5816956.1 GDP-mannose 4,6-dehydratase [Labilithrix sp.]
MSAALIIGSAGQDGLLLAAQLAERGVAVTGVDRGDVDLTAARSVADLVARVAPDAIYYLAAHHHSSEDAPEPTPVLLEKSLAVHVTGLVHVLEAAGAARVFYAASSHVFGVPDTVTQNEDTPRRPINVYGMTKSLGMDVVRHYREARGVHASSGILYNHESPLRGPTFLSSRVARAAARREKIAVGSLSASVDWGWAADYTEAMQRIVACPDPGDYVVATGEAHSVAQLAEAAFAAVGLDWREWVTEDGGILKKAGATLVGDASKLRARTGWAPTVGFADMVLRLVASRGAAA